MNINLNPEALHAVNMVTITACFLSLFNLIGKLVQLRSNRRRDALFEAMAREAMASGRPITFTNDTIKRL